MRRNGAVRVLLVEDEPDLCELLGMALERAGLFVLTAGRGPEAMALFWNAVDAGTPFDVMILDCALPGLDGWSIASNVRRAEKNMAGLRPAVLIGYTGYGEEADTLVSPDDVRRFDATFKKGDDAQDLIRCVAEAATRR